MNLYSVGQLSNVMQEVNEQHVMTVTSTSIPEAADLNAHPADNMMSMSDIKLMQEAT